MSAAPSQSREGHERVPRLAPDCDPASLELTPAEGFLLSRIDGATPIRLLRQMGGLPPEDVDRCLERWVSDGAIVLPEGAAPEAPPATAAAALEESHIDASLEISEELQRRVLDFEACLDRPYHEILGVERDADTRTIKKAYFALSKEFHPDRYFRLELGAYQDRIGAIWRRVLEAYELLSDPQTRIEVQKNEAESAAGPSPREGGPNLLQLRAHMRMFGGRGRNAAQDEARSRKARSFFDSGMAAFDAERWLEAAGSIRLALAFDPNNHEFKQAFVTVQQRAHEEKATELARQADGAYELRDFRDALRLYEEAACYRPCDAALNHRVGWLYWKLGEDPKRAKEFAVTACELEPECAEYHMTLGCIYKAGGLGANAKREFQRVLKLAPKHEQARQELKDL